MPGERRPNNDLEDNVIRRLDEAPKKFEIVSLLQASYHRFRRSRLWDSPPILERDNDGQLVSNTPYSATRST